MDGGDRHGKGIYTYPNGDVYAGSWIQNKFDGRGYYIFGRGDRYEGQLKANNKHGVGTYYFAKNGNVYKGEWKDNLRTG